MRGPASTRRCADRAAYGIIRNVEKEKEDARKKRDEERKAQEEVCLRGRPASLTVRQKERKERGEADAKSAEAGTAPKTRKAGA